VIVAKGVPDEYGSGANLCWEDVGLDSASNIICRKGHTIEQMLRDSRALARPYAEEIWQRYLIDETMLPRPARK
jgi:hypothetical protein